MESLSEKVGISKEEILLSLHEVIVESALNPMGDVTKNHILVLSALYHYFAKES